MFSKAESRELREAFWISFGKSYPKKWVLYKTGIKGLSLKFHFDTKQAMVSLDVEGDLEQRIALWEKLLSLSAIFKNYVPLPFLMSAFYWKMERKFQGYMWP